MATGKQLQKKCVRLTWWFCLFFRVLKGYNRYIGQNARRLSDDLAKCTLKMPKWNAQERNDEKEIELLTMRLSKREREQNVWKQKTIKWSRHVMSLHWMDEFCSRFFILIHTQCISSPSLSFCLCSVASGFSVLLIPPFTFYLFHVFTTNNLPQVN